jgi:hypothetical protein
MSSKRSWKFEEGDTINYTIPNREPRYLVVTSINRRIPETYGFGDDVIDRTDIEAHSVLVPWIFEEGDTIRFSESPMEPRDLVVTSIDRPHQRYGFGGFFGNKNKIEAYSVLVPWRFKVDDVIRFYQPNGNFLICVVKSIDKINQKYGIVNESDNESNKYFVDRTTIEARSVLISRHHGGKTVRRRKKSRGKSRRRK